MSSVVAEPNANAVRSSPEAPERARLSAAAVGVLCGLGAYLAWGFVPLYFHLLKGVNPFEILAHRVIWSFLLLLGINTLLRRGGALRAAWQDRRTRYALLGSTALIATNWYTYVWAATHDQVLQGSLGYFINPLVNVLLGMLLLGERLRRLQKMSVVLALVGVVVMTAATGQVPWIALFLALTFAFYGLLRKTMRADGLVGLTFETGFLTPLALGALLYFAQRGGLAFGNATPLVTILLLLASVQTVVPLLLFAAAARRVSLTALGFMQYVAPTLQFVMGLLLGETVSRAQLLSFALIWLALAIFSLDAARLWRQRRAAAQR